MFARRRPKLTGSAAVARHQHDFFRGHGLAERRSPLRAPGMRLPDLYVHEIGPGPRFPGWTYASVGVWAATHSGSGHGLEFLMASRGRDDRLVELVEMAAHYHAGPPTQRLDLGHTVPIGEPWLPGSACDHELVSLPYLYGPDLEHCVWDGGHARHLWLLPITEAERDFKAEHGLGALERRLEDAGIDATDPARPSVV